MTSPILPKPPLPPVTVLSHGGLAAGEPGALKPKTRRVRVSGVYLDDLPAVREWMTSGKANFVDIDPDMARRGARTMNHKTYSDFVAISLSIFSDPRDVHIADGLVGTANLIDQGVDFNRVTSMAQHQRNFQRARKKLQQYQARAHALHAASGLNAGVPTQTGMTFRFDNGVEALKLPRGLGQKFLTDERFNESHKLLGAALGSRPSMELKQLAARAVRASAVERKAFDGIAIPSIEDRAAAANRLAQRLRDPKLTPKERTANVSLLVGILTIDQTPAAYFSRLVLDALPLIGQIRSGESSLENASAARQALEKGQIAEAAAYAAAAVVDASGAVLGIRAPGKLVGKAISKVPLAKKAIASRDLGRAMKEKDLPPQSFKSIAEPEDWEKLTTLQQRYATSLFNIVKGRELETLMSRRMRELGLTLRRGPDETSRTKLTFEIPETKQNRVFDEVTVGHHLRRIVGLAVPVRKPGRHTGFEAKSDNAQLSTRQKDLDEEIRNLRREQEVELDDTPILREHRHHNRPPEPVEEPRPDRLSPTPDTSEKLSKVDQIILLRLPVQQINPKTLAKAFSDAVNKPGNAGMNRVKNRKWSLEDLKKIIDIVVKYEQKIAKDKSTVLVGDVIAGVMARLAISEEHHRQGE